MELSTKACKRYKKNHVLFLYFINLIVLTQSFDLFPSFTYLAVFCVFIFIICFLFVLHLIDFILLSLFYSLVSSLYHKSLWATIPVWNMWYKYFIIIYTETKMWFLMGFFISLTSANIMLANRTRTEPEQNRTRTEQNRTEPEPPPPSLYSYKNQLQRLLRFKNVSWTFFPKTNSHHRENKSNELIWSNKLCSLTASVWRDRKHGGTFQLWGMCCNITDITNQDYSCSL